MEPAVPGAVLTGGAIPPWPRDRRPYVVLLVATIALGLGSRRYGSALPPFVAAYAGDTLWAAAVYWGLALLWPRQRTAVVAATALTVAVLVEVSQLYHAPWLDAVRGTWPGALVLGEGFLWSDLACYAVGVAAAVTIDLGMARRRRQGFLPT